MPELLITLSDGRTIRHVLGDRPETIGRDAACEIPIDDASASRRHARFVPSAQGYRVEDLGSKNGTLVNDKPSASTVLRNGDQVLLGSTFVEFCDGRVEPESAVTIAEDATLTRSHATRYVSRDQRLHLSQRRLEMLYELGGRLTTLQSRDTLLDSAMDICFEMLHFERGSIGLRARQGRGVEWPVVRNLRGREGELTISRTLLSRALEYGERAIFTDSDTANADPTMSIVQHGIRSAMCVPLLHDDNTIGVIYGDRTSTSTPYTDEDIDFFAAIAQQISIGLINARLMEDQQEMIRLTREIELARKIQTGLFPSQLPDREGLRVAALNDPGQRVSGDYYDVIERPDGRLWCLIADVTGEGVAAALMMANLQAAVRVTIDQSDDPGELLGRWNRLVFRNTSNGRFITCLLSLIDPAARTIRFSNAGHCAPMLARGAEAATEVASEAFFPLGIVEDASYVSNTIPLGEGPAAYFQYTDGVIEAVNPDGDLYGSERLIQSLSERSDPNPSALVKAVRKSVASFAGAAPQSDDITMLAVRLG